MCSGTAYYDVYIEDKLALFGGKHCSFFMLGSLHDSSGREHTQNIVMHVERKRQSLSSHGHV